MKPNYLVITILTLSLIANFICAFFLINSKRNMQMDGNKEDSIPLHQNTLIYSAFVKKGEDQDSINISAWIMNKPKNDVALEITPLFLSSWKEDFQPRLSSLPNDGSQFSFPISIKTGLKVETDPLYFSLKGHLLDEKGEIYKTLMDTISIEP